MPLGSPGVTQIIAIKLDSCFLVHHYAQNYFSKRLRKRMITTETALIFFSTSILLALAPGPDNLFVMAQAARHGCNAGLLVTLGLCTGLLFHTSAVTFGLAALFAASATAFAILKCAGAGYLLYLAWITLRAGAAAGASGTAPDPAPGSLYRRGIIMNITNPKVSVFFLAFLPQFSSPAKGSLPLQFLILGGIFIVSTIIVFGAVSLLAGAFGERFRNSSSTNKMLNLATACVYAALAVKLALAQR